MFFNDFFVDGLTKETYYFPLLCRYCSQHIYLIFSFNCYCERRYDIHWLAVYLNWQYDVFKFGLKGESVTLSDLEGLVHAHLDLSHVQDVSEPYDFDQPIAIAIVFKVTSLLPQVSDSSSPMVNIHDN